MGITASIIDVTEVIDVFETIEKQGFVVTPRGMARIAGSIPDRLVFGV